MLQRYNKLVRDNVPAAIQKTGAIPHYSLAENDETFFFKLKEKLQEEFTEFVKSESMESMAEIFELLEAICKVKGFDFGELQAIRENKNIGEGTYSGRIILEEIEEIKKHI